MSRSRWFLTLTVTLLLLVTGFSCARDEAGTEQAVGGELVSQRQARAPEVRWLDFNDGLAKARTEKKPIFVEFYTDWCVYCEMFQRKTIHDQSVAKMLSENFAYVRLNAEDSRKRLKFNGQSLSNTELTSSFGITAFPSLVFLDSGGQPISMLSGFLPPRQFAAVLGYVYQECYRTETSLDEFTRKGNCD